MLLDNVSGPLKLISAQEIVWQLLEQILASMAGIFTNIQTAKQGRNPSDQKQKALEMGLQVEIAGEKD